MENEFDILNRRMEKNLEMRHTYLMFAFTTSIAAIAALFIANFANITSWICIVPFAVIIPFQARISYSRLSHAKMEAYIKSYYADKFRFLENPINELSGIMGRVIAVISNYELTLLALIIDLLYLLNKKCILDSAGIISIDSIAIFIVTIIVFALATYTFPYAKFVEKYEKIYKDEV